MSSAQRVGAPAGSSRKRSATGDSWSIDGVVERTQYDDAPPRYEYGLTDKGRALWGVIAMMWQFGDDWMFDESPGSYVELIDKRTGDPIRPTVIDGNTNEPIDLPTVRVRMRRHASN